MAQAEDIEKIMKAFTPVVTVTGFQDTGASIVAQVRQEYPDRAMERPGLGTHRTFTVILDKKTGRLESLGWLFK